MGYVELNIGPTIKSKEFRPATIVLPTESNILNQFYEIKERVKYKGYQEMSAYVKANLHDLLNMAIDKKPKALQIIVDKDFLIAMDSCDIELNKDYTIKFNRIYRSYMMNPESNPLYNKEIESLLYTNAKKINKRLILILIGLGLPEEIATRLIVNRYSSTDERRNIRRMTREMQHCDKSIMTEQMIVNIYSKTCSTQLTDLFCTVMEDRFETFIDENENYVYSTVSNALLDILSTMSYSDIEDILRTYIRELETSGITGRFKLNSINNEDYYRINMVLEKLDSEGVEFI